MLGRNKGHATTRNMVLLIPALGQNNRITLSNESYTPSLLVSSLKDEQVRSERKKLHCYSRNYTL